MGEQREVSEIGEQHTYGRMAARGRTASGQQRLVACTVAHTVTYCQGKEIYSASKPQRAQSRRAEVLR